MTDRYMIGWVRDERGRILSRPRKDISNAITSFVGGASTPPMTASRPPRPTLSIAGNNSLTL